MSEKIAFHQHSWRSDWYVRVGDKPVRRAIQFGSTWFEPHTAVFELVYYVSSTLGTRTTVPATEVQPPDKIPVWGVRLGQRVPGTDEYKNKTRPEYMDAFDLLEFWFPEFIGYDALIREWPTNPKSKKPKKESPTKALIPPNFIWHVEHDEGSEMRVAIRQVDKCDRRSRLPVEVEYPDLGGHKFFPGVEVETVPVSEFLDYFSRYFQEVDKSKGYPGWFA